MCESGGKAYRWTFAGGRANASLAEELGRRLEGDVSSDNFCIQVGAGAHLGAVARAIESLRGVDPRQIVPSVSEDALQGLKFSVCLPPHVASEVVREHFADGPGVAQVIERRPRVVIEGITGNRGSDSINSRYGQTQGFA